MSWKKGCHFHLPLLLPVKPLGQKAAQQAMALPPPGLAPTLPPTEPLPHSGRVTNPGHVSKFPDLQRCKREGKERGKEGKGERKERNGKGVTNSSTIK